MQWERGVVLLAEDDDDAYMLFEMAWETAGFKHKLHRAADGQAAILYLEGTATCADGNSTPLPCLVVLDIKMPKMDGFEVLKWMRQEERFDDVPVVVLSASSAEVDRETARRLGVEDYLVKPVGFDALVEMVKKIHAKCVQGGAPLWREQKPASDAAKRQR